MVMNQQEWRQVAPDESAGFIVYQERFTAGGGLSWKRWCGPWGSMEKAQGIIDREIAPKHFSKTFVAAEALIRPVQMFNGGVPDPWAKTREIIIPAYQARIAELQGSVG